MKKKIHIYALLFALFLIGCEETANTDSLPGLEPYIEESSGQDASPAVKDVEDDSVDGIDLIYLKAVTLQNDAVVVTTYAFDTVAYAGGKDSVISQKDGVSIQSCLVSGKSGLDTGISGILDNIKSDKANSRIQVPERSDAMTVNFDRTMKNVVYPSRCYIYTESVKDDIYLISAVTVDTSSATDQTVGILKEISGMWDIR